MKNRASMGTKAAAGSRRADKEGLISFVLVLVAVMPTVPLYSYSRYAGINSDIATIFYFTGLVVGILLMSISVAIHRRMNTDNEIHGEKIESGSQSRDRKKNLIKKIPAFFVLFIFIIGIFTIRSYAPGSNALFVPMVYCAGLIFGAFTVLIGSQPVQPAFPTESGQDETGR